MVSVKAGGKVGWHGENGVKVPFSPTPVTSPELGIDNVCCSLLKFIVAHVPLRISSKFTLSLSAQKSCLCSFLLSIHNPFVLW